VQTSSEFTTGLDNLEIRDILLFKGLRCDDTSDSTAEDKDLLVLVGAVTG
jgi:hypothetical protein